MMTSLSLSEFVQDLEKILKHSPPERSVIEEKVQALFTLFVEETKDLHNREALINKADKVIPDVLGDARFQTAYYDLFNFRYSFRSQALMADEGTSCFEHSISKESELSFSESSQ